jgi:hypothetical protein
VLQGFTVPQGGRQEAAQPEARGDGGDINVLEI